ncbi:MAG: hypothetical protein K2I95_06435 [Treponemataceae bacterium]|nr:hypothetical protein [Treponemataceae bacterium]
MFVPQRKSEPFGTPNCWAKSEPFGTSNSLTGRKASLSTSRIRPLTKK